MGRGSCRGHLGWPLMSPGGTGSRLLCIPRTPLHCAASCNDTAICTALVQHGAAIFATTLSDGATAIEKCDPYREGYADCATYLAGVRQDGALGHLQGRGSWELGCPSGQSWEWGRQLTATHKSEDLDRLLRLCGRIVEEGVTERTACRGKETGPPTWQVQAGVGGADCATFEGEKVARAVPCKLDTCGEETGWRDYPVHLLSHLSGGDGMDDCTIPSTWHRWAVLPKRDTMPHSWQRSGPWPLGRGLGTLPLAGRHEAVTYTSRRGITSRNQVTRGTR